MGAGHYPDFAPDMDNDAFCKEFIVVDEAHNVVDAAYTEKYTDDPNYGFLIIIRGTINILSPLVVISVLFSAQI